jgi:hypothetical protein
MTGDRTAARPGQPWWPAGAGRGRDRYRSDDDPYRATMTSPQSDPVLTIRVAGDDDRAALRRLASLDGAGLPDGPAMLGELGGEPVAAVNLADGRVVADRSRAGSAMIAMLHLHRLEARVIGSIWGV